jgi:iron complex transport system substrate-binding protein
MAYFKGSAPHIVGYSGSFKETISETALKNIVPKLIESSNTVYAQSDLNIEEIIKFKPDVIFYNTNNKEHAQMLASSGIPSIGSAAVGTDFPVIQLKGIRSG